MKLFLDACAIIYWVEMAEPQHQKFTKHLLKYRTKNLPSFAASQLSLLECRVKPLRDKNEDLLKRYQQFFCAADLTLVPITPTILEEALSLRAFHSLRTPDAIQAACALSLKDSVMFITGDRSFKKIKSLNIDLI